MDFEDSAGERERVDLEADFGGEVGEEGECSCHCELALGRDEVELDWKKS